MNSGNSWNQLGWLEICFYVAALIVVVGSVVGGWTFNILIGLMLLATVYAVLCDIRALTRLKTRNKPAQSSERIIPL